MTVMYVFYSSFLFHVVIYAEEAVFDQPRSRRQQYLQSSIGKARIRITHPATAKATPIYNLIKTITARDHVSLRRNLRK